ncbi:Follistatin-related protein 1 [Willisornis vidua]|uniref:Follistatin-related protein 1 n=1 Tax=Willisornis vidua TaxID=1566151 RepID=A0ABQ9DKF4_9PASS|nr:Follistatin-related protein 1 [Willisornis vidua]
MIWKTLPLLCALLAAARLRAEGSGNERNYVLAQMKIQNSALGQAIFEPSELPIDTFAGLSSRTGTMCLLDARSFRTEKQTLPRQQLDKVLDFMAGCRVGLEIVQAVLFTGSTLACLETPYIPTPVKHCGQQEEPRSKSKICANVFCGAGRECAVTEKGEPTCLCIEKCKPHKRPVCGSNGKTYLNHCELHRDACLTGSKIQVDYDGHCKEKKSENPAASPVVCYQSDRDELRRRVIQWLEAEIIPDGWFSKGSNYSEVLDKYFKASGAAAASEPREHFLPCHCKTAVPPNQEVPSFDDGDSRLDSTEFLKFVEQNETAINITTYMDQETNRLLRGLCVDALIELSDENADWKLSFNEFLKCLSPSFNPPEKKCALEDETYEDGAETQVECNRCVCACGNWVCTAMTCEGRNEKVPAQRHRPDQDLTEEEVARYIQELQKHQETSAKTKRMSTKEM